MENSLSFLDGVLIMIAISLILSLVIVRLVILKERWDAVASYNNNSATAIRYPDGNDYFIIRKDHDDEYNQLKYQQTFGDEDDE